MQNCFLTWQYVNNSLHIWWQLWHIPPWVSSGCGYSPVLSYYIMSFTCLMLHFMLTLTTVVLVWSWHKAAVAADVYLDHVLGSVVTCTKQSSETLCQPLCYCEMAIWFTIQQHVSCSSLWSEQRWWWCKLPVVLLDHLAGEACCVPVNEDITSPSTPTRANTAPLQKILCVVLIIIKKDYSNICDKVGMW